MVSENVIPGALRWIEANWPKDTKMNPLSWSICRGRGIACIDGCI
jgi:hypothetical protein